MLEQVNVQVNDQASVQYLNMINCSRGPERNESTAHYFNRCF